MAKKSEARRCLNSAEFVIALGKGHDVSLGGTGVGR